MAIVRAIILLGTKKRSRLDSSKADQKVPLVATGFTKKLRFKNKTGKKPEPVKGSHRHHGGPVLNTIYSIRQQPWMMMGAEELTYDQETIANHIPNMQLAVLSVDRSTGLGTPLTAAEATRRRQEHPNWMPFYYANPMQDLDYMVIEQLTRNTILGSLTNTLSKFIVGQGFKPELELIKPSGNDEQDREEIEAQQDIIDDLIAIDSLVGEGDVDFKDKVTALITCTNTFNRAALIFGYSSDNKPVEINGRRYVGIPTSVKFAHPRDLGMIKVDPATWKLLAVQWRNAYSMIPANDMIYLWNPVVSATTRGSWLYGDSMILPMIDAARTLRKNIGVNFPAMAEVSWAGSAILWVRPRGTTDSQKQQEWSDITSRFVRGAPNVMLESPEDVKVDTLEFNPKVNEFVNMNDSLIKYCIAVLGLPHSLFYDEDSSNRATMLGKIQLAISVTINPLRSWIGRMIAEQWYQRNFKIICEQSNRKDLLKKFRVKMVYSDLHIEEWFDRIEAVNKIDERKALNDKDYGELAGIENYEQKVVPDAEVTPGGKKGFEFMDDNGKGFEIQNKNKPVAPMKASVDKELLGLKKEAYRKYLAEEKK